MTLTVTSHAPRPEQWVCRPWWPPPPAVYLQKLEHLIRSRSIAGIHCPLSTPHCQIYRLNRQQEKNPILINITRSYIDMRFIYTQQLYLYFKYHYNDNILHWLIAAWESKENIITQRKYYILTHIHKSSFTKLSRLSPVLGSVIRNF